MHIDDAEETRNLVLHFHPILEGAKIVAEVQRIGRLHTRKDKLRVRGFVRHGDGSGNWLKRVANARDRRAFRRAAKARWAAGSGAGLSEPSS
jgi:hypothetical protein